MTNKIFSGPLSRFRFLEADCVNLNIIVKLARRVPFEPLKWGYINRIRRFYSYFQNMTFDNTSFLPAEEKSDDISQ